jgi:hypothetical protein
MTGAAAFRPSSAATRVREETMQPKSAATENADVVEREDDPLLLPWRETWRREAHETVVTKSWPLVVAPLVGHVDRRVYMPNEVERRLRLSPHTLLTQRCPSPNRRLS